MGLCHVVSRSFATSLAQKSRFLQMYLQIEPEEDNMKIKKHKKYRIVGIQICWSQLFIYFQLFSHVVKRSSKVFQHLNLKDVQSSVQKTKEQNGSWLKPSQPLTSTRGVEFASELTFRCGFCGAVVLAR